MINGQQLLLAKVSREDKMKSLKVDLMFKACVL